MNKPKCKLIGENGNIYNLVGIAGECLREHGMEDKQKELYDRLYSCKSYDEALCLISEYVEVY